MAHEPLGPVLQHIRQLVGPPQAADTPDRDLLRRFVLHRDEGAFAALLRRHGPLVLGVCRRVLNDTHEAEDAFQATFLLLARRAAAIRRPEVLNNWLYGVAYRIARRAQTYRRRQPAGQGNIMDFEQPARTVETDRHHLRPVLDEELSRLPDRYRVPFLLCYVEGKTQNAAARHLGWTSGSVKGRLERARELLRRRLARRGISLSASAFTTTLTETVWADALPDRLVLATLRAGLAYASGETAGLAPAIVLAEEAMRTAIVARIRFVAVVILAVGLLGGTSVWQISRPADIPTEPVRADDVGEKRPAAPLAGQPNRTDLFGDALPPGALLRLGTVRWRPGMQTNGLAVAPDGTCIAVANEVGLSLWDAGTGNQIRLFHRDRAEDALFAGDGAVLMSRSGIKLRFWETKTGKLLREFQPKPEGQEEFINDSFVSADGRVFAATTSTQTDRTFRLHVYEVATGKLSRRWLVPAMPFRVALTDDGKVLAAQEFSKDGAIVRLWDTATGTEIRRLPPTKQSIWRMAFSPDGKALACGGHALEKDGDNQQATVTIWDVATGELRHTLDAGTGFGGQVYALAYSPDSRRLVAGGGDNSIRLWDAATATEQHCMRGHDSAPHAFAFTRDGKTVVAADNASTIRLWDGTTGRETTPVRGHQGWVEAGAWLLDANTLVTHGARTVRFWDAATGRDLRSFTGVESSGIHCVALCPAKKLLAAVTHPYQEIRLWDLNAGKIVRRIETVEGTSTVVFAPDGRTLAGIAEKTVYLWDPVTGRKLHQLEGHTAGVRCAAFSSDGRLLGTGGIDGDKTVRLWDVVTGKAIQRLVTAAAPQDPKVQYVGYGIEGVAFAPDGQVIAACGCDADEAFISLWDIATGREFRKIKLPERDEPGGRDAHFGLTYSPDGKTLATTGWARETRLWEVATGTESRRLSGHRGGVLSLVFAADGRTLLTGSQDTSGLLWDLVGPTAEEAAQAARLTEADLHALGNELAALEAVPAHRAVRILTAAPAVSVPLLRQRLTPAAAVDRRQVERWIADLDSPRFEARTGAAAELERLGDSCMPAVEKALAAQPALEVRQRLEQLVERLKGTVPPAGQRLGLRGVMVLEHVGTPAAREVLRGLANGAPEARVTREAQAALQRLARHAQEHHQP